MHIRYRIHIHIQCIHALGLSSAYERPSHKSQVQIGRVTTQIIVHDHAAGVKKHVLLWH
jgi:hypothetical protein